MSSASDGVLAVIPASTDDGTLSLIENPFGCSDCATDTLAGFVSFGFAIALPGYTSTITGRPPAASEMRT